MLLPFYVPLYQSPPADRARGEMVVLLHGIFTTGLRLARLHRRLLKEGYAVLSITYPSRRFVLADIAAEVSAHIQDHHKSGEILHMVGYSMGGLVARAYVERNDPIRPKRIVCLGTPNRGTEYVDEVLKRPLTSWLFRQLAGPPGMEMATEGGVTDTLGPVPADIELGVIAGNRNYLLWPPMPGDHDGKVPVERTKIEGMTDHITLPVGHIAMSNDREVINQTLAFLQNGRFDH